MLYLVTGGSGSGKSAYAEDLAGKLSGERGGNLFYVATMYSYDEEGDARIERHRAQRAGKDFKTIEIPTNFAQVFGTAGDVFLVEDLSNLLANEMYLDEGEIKTEEFPWEDAGEKNGEMPEWDAAPGERAAADSACTLLWEKARKRIAEPLLSLAETCDVIVVTNEIFSEGCVLSEETFAYVQLLGKLNVLLAAQAEKVTEVVFGIPLPKKGG